MQKSRYGILNGGELLTADTLLPNYKPIEYAVIPEDFNQQTHYLVQKEPVEFEEYIYLGIEIKELQLDDVEEAHLESVE